MKCVAIKGVKEFEIRDIKEPAIDHENVIVEVKKSGICGSDIHYWVAGEPRGLVMGHEFSGIVKDPGSRVDLKIGDRVTGLPISPCGNCKACLSGNPQYCPSTWTNAVGLSLTNPGALTKKIKVRPDMINSYFVDYDTMFGLIVIVFLINCIASFISLIAYYCLENRVRHFITRRKID